MLIPWKRIPSGDDAFVEVDEGGLIVVGGDGDLQDGVDGDVAVVAVGAGADGVVGVGYGGFGRTQLGQSLE